MKKRLLFDHLVESLSFRDGREERNEDVGSRRSSSLPQLPISSSTGCSMDEVLQLVRQLYIHMEHGQADQFLSKKITNKLVTQIQVQTPLIFN